MSSGILKQNGEVSGGGLEQGATSEAIPLNSKGFYRPGILIFSRRQKLLHANRRALKMTGHLDQADSELVSEIHWAPVGELLNAIQASLDHRRDANVWEPFELKWITFENRCKILIRGIGLADRKSHDDSRIVIVLEELGIQEEPSEPRPPAMGLFQESGSVTVRRSAQRGSDRGVFDTCMEGAP